MGALDDALGRKPISQTPAGDIHSDRKEGAMSEEATTEATLGDQDSVWQKTAVSDPRAWHRRGNPITSRVARSLAGDAELPYDEASIAKDCRRVAADLLAECSGDEVLLLKAQERLRRGSGWKGLGLYVQKKALVHEVHKIRAARRQFSLLLDDDPIAELQTFECPKCHQMVYNEMALKLECLHHFERRAEYYTWKEAEGG